jgi:hypothetical protein
MIAHLSVLTTLLFQPSLAVLAIPIFALHGKNKFGHAFVVFCAIIALQSSSKMAPAYWIMQNEAAVGRMKLVLEWLLRLSLALTAFQALAKCGKKKMQLNLKQMLL